MSESFDAFAYLSFLLSRWRLIAIATILAALLALFSSLLMQKRYTATASIVIDPPGSNDVRTATAISPVYLESLRTYERFAASDSLFQRAVQRFKLQDTDGSQPIEALKKRVLKVSKLRDTKILEIAVTLPDPKIAQSLVEYLAKQTVAMSQEESLAADREQIADLEKQVADAETKLREVRAKWTANLAAEPTQALQSEIEASAEVLANTRKELIAAESDAAAYQDQAEEFAKREVAAARARAALLQRRIDSLERSVAASQTMLAQRLAKRDALQMDLKAAQLASDNSLARVREQRAFLGTRGERLRIIDPGIVPQNPSSPNIALNVFTALVCGLLASFLYVSMSFAFRDRVLSVKDGRSRFAARI